MAKVLLLLLFLHWCATPTSCYAPPSHQLCQNGNYTANSTFHSNLIALLTSLANATTATNSTFSTDIVGSSPDRVYGLFLCRGDVGPPECQACVQTASQNVTLICDTYRKATVWYDSCELRYSDTDFFGTFSTDSYAYRVQNIYQTDPDAFGRMEQLMTGALATRAYNSSLMFATGSLWYNKDLPSIYGLVQCTRDLSPDGCGQCLQQAFYFYSKSNFQSRRGGRVLRKACNFRYETYKFYDGEPTVALNMSSPTAASTSMPPASTPLSSPIPTKQGKKNDTGKVVAVLISIAAAFALMVTLFICFRRRRSPKNIVLGTVATLEEIKSEESILIDLSILKAATNNFSNENKLGEGGFGTVYKGTLLDGQEVAVKRLSASSKQGIPELKNELLLVAKLQHKNLVRLRGVCLEEEESLLVYEYVPNRSLDTILFDCNKREELNWERRFEIIGGIARGLRYLHEESHLRVVHRDLKASNVLLDADLNPKISDFGLARLFGMDETQCNTSRVVGTFGYMAPEYAMRGRVSVKTDVFSFGVMVLEIVTGRKNSSSEEDEHAQDLLGYVWEHWSAERALEIVDTALRDQFSRDEVLRCIQVGLLCVQDVAANRPLMSMVVLMLQSSSMALQAPLQPTFGAGGRATDTDSTQRSGLGSADISASKSVGTSRNDVTITELHPR